MTSETIALQESKEWEKRRVAALMKRIDDLFPAKNKFKYPYGKVRAGNYKSFGHGRD